MKRSTGPGTPDGSRWIRRSWPAGLCVSVGFFTGCGEEPCLVELRNLATEASLDAASVVPPVADAAVAWANVFLTETGYSRGFDASVIAAPPLNARTGSSSDLRQSPPTMDPDSVVAVHVHEGGPSENGRVLLTLGNDAPDHPDAEYILATDGGGTEPGFFEILLAGRAYVDVHTMSFPDGRVRGQLEPLPGTDPSWQCLTED